MIDRADRGKFLFLGSIAVSLVLVLAYLAAGGSDYAPAKTQDPCKPREWRNPEGLQQIAAAVLALGARRRRLQARRLPRDAGPGAGHAKNRGRSFLDRYDIDDAELARAIRAGLLRAIDDAEEAGALSPLLACAAAPGDRARSRSTRRSNWSHDARSLFEGGGSIVGLGETGLGILEDFLP